MVAFGDDFKFRNAHTQFSNMDQLIKYINANSKDLDVTIQYSTVAEYTEAVYQTKTEFPVFQGR